ncbi:hypothetical protein XO10_04865 [Marinitoga sp. 1135]|uniref:Uncharacterized protein n=1 Tax=Marinitoga piezophila (strain DSM 14283 / JCM 11233 / KA3) TaxID=443254 RepID=H2J7N5_MARPK|nr:MULTISPECIES: hypothetical protein [Marinitoga]AEX85376.1 hypothetical protein Marpi_0964 [Marinitoga piezophila KA3]APT75853.1 hypothetical protein LN42_05290 [Marinitoga sp. 1137]NUU95610.1 hypothetical protein [Marinitoga sp. 1135]NUU97510.1 hypothetical protein [Marinitoga sp. 1138]
MRINVNNYYSPTEFKEKYLESKLRKILIEAINNKDNALLFKLGKISSMIKIGNISEAEKELERIDRNINEQGIKSQKNKKGISNSNEHVVNRNINNKISKNNFPETSESVVYLQDDSPDSAVSFQYPTPVSENASFLFIKSHESEHAREIIKEAMFKGKMAQVYVRYFTSYDPNGHLVYTGGVTWGKILDSKA